MLTYSLHRRTAPWNASWSIASQPRRRRSPPASASGLRAEHRTTGARREGAAPARRRTARRRRAARNRPPLGFRSSCRAEDGEDAAAGSGARGAVDTDAMDGGRGGDAMAHWVAEELVLALAVFASRAFGCRGSRAAAVGAVLGLVSLLVWIRTRPGVIRLAGSRRDLPRETVTDRWAPDGDSCSGAHALVAALRPSF